MVLRLVPQMSNEVTEISLARKIENKESIIYSISKKLKNNPCKIASVKFSNGDNVDVLVINNFKVKNKKGTFIVDTSKKEINQYRPLHKYKKYFHSPDFEIVSEPNLLLIINQRTILPYRISTLLDIRYTKKSVGKFVELKIREYKLLLNSTKTAK